MNKSFKCMLTAALAVAAGLIVTSCSPVDNPVVEQADAPAVVVSSDLLRRGIRIDKESAVVEVPVSCKGEWSAVIPKEDEWLQILDWQANFQSDQTLQVLVDENSTGSNRESKLMVADADGNVSEVKILQTNSVMNGAFTTSGSAFSEKGLGCGIDYDYILNLKKNIEREEGGEKFSPSNIRKQNNIFNMAQI